MKNLLLSGVFILLSQISFSQKIDLKKIQFKGNNVVYFEAGGLGLSHSLNYDRRFKKDDPSGFGFRVGLSGAALELGTGGIAVPLAINYIKHIIPELPHSIEAGIGATYFTPREKVDNVKTQLIPNFSIGYRMQPREKGLVLKVAYTPHIWEGQYFGHWGAAIGYKF